MGVPRVFLKELDAHAACGSAVWFAVAAMLVGVPAAYAQQTSRPQAEKTDKAAQENKAVEFTGREAIENSSCGHYRIARCGVEPDKLTVRN